MEKSSVTNLALTTTQDLSLFSDHYIVSLWNRLLIDLRDRPAVLRPKLINEVIETQFNTRGVALLAEISVNEIVTRVRRRNGLLEAEKIAEESKQEVNSVVGEPEKECSDEEHLTQMQKQRVIVSERHLDSSEQDHQSEDSESTPRRYRVTPVKDVWVDGTETFSSSEDSVEGEPKKHLI